MQVNIEYKKENLGFPIFCERIKGKTVTVFCDVNTAVYAKNILNQMKSKKLTKVLVVPTGAIFSPTRTFQKETIPSIAHAISLEVI